MATVIDVPGRLGEYMLKGWILTDKICTACSKVPLLRSPPFAPPETYLCVNCDGAPTYATAVNASSTLMASSAPQETDSQSISSHSNNSSMSGSFTPPTEVSNAMSSPTFAPIMDTTELMHRRQQSDTASAEIGRRMLKGWAMLADECPSPDCYGIPLVRPPKSGGNINPMKECVICKIVYIDEKDAFGRDCLVPLQLSAGTSQLPNLSSAPPASSFVDKGKTRATSSHIMKPQVAVPHLAHTQSATIHTGSSTSSALEGTAHSLESTLVGLSERLKVYANGSIIDPGPISQTADAIYKVSQALSQVKQLLWSERQALLS